MLKYSFFSLLLQCFFTCFFVSCKKSNTSNINPVIVTDSFTVTVSNGYGTGKYKVGDTVHIFSNGLASNQLFDQWSSTDVNLLKSYNEWETYFIMPSRNLGFSGAVKNITPFTLTFTQIKGKNILKPVYYFFPANHKGWVFLLHGTGGTAQNVATNYEFQQLTKELVNDGFGVVITESEETGLNTDFNGDGKLRWLTNPADSINNIDYANIKAISDSIYARGWSSRIKPRFSVGMSNGGAFSATLSYYYQFKAGVSYCAPGGTVVAGLTNTPFQFCMARYDNNENVGPQGNADAFNNSQTIINRGFCSKYFIKERAPIYPERFARTGVISVAKSQSLFLELKGKGFLDARNYFKGFSSDLITVFQSNPASFPELNSIPLAQKLIFLEEIDLSVSDHQMYSDYNKATLRFLNIQCL